MITYFFLFANRFKTAVPLKLRPGIVEKFRKYIAILLLFSVLNCFVAIFIEIFKLSTILYIFYIFSVSSSNESISAFSPISSSNEGYIDAKINDSYRSASKLSYPGRRPHTAGILMIIPSENIKCRLFT